MDVDGALAWHTKEHRAQRVQNSAETVKLQETRTVPLTKGAPLAREIEIIRLKVENSWSYGQARAHFDSQFKNMETTHIKSIMEQMTLVARQTAIESNEVQELCKRNDEAIQRLDKLNADLEASNQKLNILAENKLRLQHEQNKLQIAMS
jgi:hypothetical protein